MESGATRTAAGRPGRIDRRPVAAGDESFLLNVYASTRADEMAFVPWSDVEKEAFLKGQLQAQQHDYDARYPDATHEIILLDERPIGRIWIGRGPEEIRLLDIAFLPPYRGLGVGTVLLKELQREAARLGTPMRHCVYKPNRPALAFYARLGFTIIGEQGLYYLMEWTDTKRIAQTAAT